MPQSVHVAGMCCENLRLASKPPVTMDSMSPGTIPSLARPIINFDRSACILFTIQVYALYVIIPASPECLVAGKSIAFNCVTNLGKSRLPPLVHAKSTVRRTNTRCTMASSQSIRKGAWGSRNVGPEPQNLTLVNEDSDVRASFEQVGCMVFCRKIQGFNVKLAEQFALSFNGLCAVIAGSTFQVTKETLSTATEIPPRRERWSKGMPLDVLCYEEFIKPGCLNGKVEAGIPSRYLQEPFQKFLRAIRKYFTCERRFDRIHPHHIRLLMDFTGRKPLNLPFFLHRSLQEMADNVRAETNQPKKKLSHVSLIKLLIVEELRQLRNNWDSFLLTAGIPRDPRGDSHLPAKNPHLIAWRQK
jgi:hypothetical protein